MRPKTDKLQNLHDDVNWRDAVPFRMHAQELARSGLYNAKLDVLTPELVNWIWRRRVAARG